MPTLGFKRKFFSVRCWTVHNSRYTKSVIQHGLGFFGVQLAMSSYYYVFALIVVFLLLRPAPVQASDSAKKQIESLVSAHKVQIFSKSYCPYCRRAKGIFDDAGIPYNALELDQAPNGAEIQSTLAGITGQRTVPSVWINGKFVGGSDKVAELSAKGLLAGMVNQEREL